MYDLDIPGQVELAREYIYIYVLIYIYIQLVYNLSTLKIEERQLYASFLSLPSASKANKEKAAKALYVSLPKTMYKIFFFRFM